MATTLARHHSAPREEVKQRSMELIRHLSDYVELGTDRKLRFCFFIQSCFALPRKRGGHECNIPPYFGVRELPFLSMVVLVSSYIVIYRRTFQLAPEPDAAPARVPRKAVSEWTVV